MCIEYRIVHICAILPQITATHQSVAVIYYPITMWCVCTILPQYILFVCYPSTDYCDATIYYNYILSYHNVAGVCIILPQFTLCVLDPPRTTVTQQWVIVIHYPIPMCYCCVLSSNMCQLCGLSHPNVRTIPRQSTTPVPPAVLATTMFPIRTITPPPPTHTHTMTKWVERPLSVFHIGKSNPDWIKPIT